MIMVISVFFKFFVNMFIFIMMMMPEIIFELLTRRFVVVMLMPVMMLMGVCMPFGSMFMKVLVFFHTKCSDVGMGAFYSALNAFFKAVCDIRNAK